MPIILKLIILSEVSISPKCLSISDSMIESHNAFTLGKTNIKIIKSELTNPTNPMYLKALTGSNSK